MNNNNKIEKEKNDNIIFRVPAALKEDFKIACIDSDIHMSDAIRSFMEAFCESSKNKNKKTGV